MKLIMLVFGTFLLVNGAMSVTVKASDDIDGVMKFLDDFEKDFKNLDDTGDLSFEPLPESGAVEREVVPVIEGDRAVQHEINQRISELENLARDGGR